MFSSRLVVGLVLFAFTASAHAQQSRIEERLAQLEEEIRLLRRQLEVEKEQAEQKAKQAPVVTAGKDGFSSKSGDGGFALKVRGYVQADGRFFASDDAGNGVATFVMRRVRPILEGTLWKNFDFRVMSDFGNDGASLFDAYLEWKLSPWFKVRSGKFKPPVGLERLQSATDTFFAERALPTGLVPTRDIGVQVGGEIREGVVQYQAGVFNGVVDGGNGGVDNGDGKDVAARVILEPFRRTTIRSLQGLGFGVAGTIGNQEGSLAAPNLPNLRSPGQSTFFRYITGSTLPSTVVAAGRRTRIAPQGYHYAGPFGLMGEYTVSEQEVQKGTSRDSIRLSSWQAAGSVVLTGEPASFKGVTPRRSFDWANRDLGAVELAFRWSGFDVDSRAFPVYANPASAASEARAWAVGLNWYLNRNVRIMADYEQTRFHGGAANGANRETERVVFTRTQFSF